MTPEQQEARRALMRRDPAMIYDGRRWSELEFEQQAELREYMRARRVRINGDVITVAPLADRNVQA
jgi:hypothetical protein